MKKPLISALLGCLFGGAPAFSQEFIAYQINAAQAGNQSAGASLGLDFNVVNAITVNRLGCFDDLGNGFVGTITVELWSRNDSGTPTIRADDLAGSLLTSITFSSGTPGTLIGSHRFKDLAASVDLAPGSYTIVAYGFSANDRNYNTNGNPGLAPVSGETGNGITYFGRRFGATGQYPATADGPITSRYGAGSFSFELLDSDSDGMPDTWEDLFSLDKNSASDASGDLDVDGLTNLEEYLLGTNPEEGDSDTDGVGDAEEEVAGTNPLNPDSDFDGLRDGVEDDSGTFADEDNTGTDPLAIDSDLDGYDDGAEIELLTDPTDATATPLGSFGQAAYAAAKNRVGNQAAPGSLGMDFDVDGRISIGYLGAFDDGSDGFTNPITVEIWGRNNGGTPNDPSDDTGVGNSPLVQIVISPGEGFLQGSNRFKALPTPFVIDTNNNPSSYSIVAFGFSAADQNVNLFGAAAAGNGLSLADNLAVSFVGTSRFAPGGATGVFPTSFDGGPANRYAAGTFAFTTGDLDGDGMPDFWEELYGLNPNSSADASLDGDNDGLSNLREFQNDLIPNDPDTDDDDLNDGDELTAGTNPKNRDSDGDTLTDGAEVNGTTSPLLADTDGDDFTDNFELAQGTDPNNVNDFPSVPQRGDLAYFSTAGSVGNQTNFAGSAGLDFVVNTPIVIRELGAFDSGDNGFIGEITVQLWSRSDSGTPDNFADDLGGAVLGQVVFGPANRGILRDGYRTQALAAPLTLPAGSYSIVASGFGVNDPMGNAGLAGGGGPDNFIITNDALSFVGPSRFLGTPASFPTNLDTGPANRYSAGTFAFSIPSNETLITDFDWNNTTRRGSVTFTSLPGSSYELEYSADLTAGSWFGLNDVIATASATTLPIAIDPVPGTTKLFFRVRNLE